MRKKIRATTRKRAAELAPAGAPTAAAHGSASAKRAVVVGGSAGSLDALEAFFEDLPVATAAAFVIVTHRDARSKGMMTEIIDHLTSMPVRGAADGEELRAGTVYLLPTGFALSIRSGRVRLRAMASRKRGVAPSSIDDTFCAVASAFREHAIGVLLSGMGSDGTAGMRAIKQVGGLTLAQAPASAQFDAMPKSAIESGTVDLVGSPSELAKHVIVALARDVSGGEPQSEVHRILALLTARTGHDFASYKRSTIGRRIERRMSALGLQRIEQYRAFLEGDSTEANRLFQDLLIGVTRFFREPEMFDVLKQALPPALVGWSEERPIRVWVAGCATGEEAYSLAIVLREIAEDRGNRRLPMQIYATDLDQRAIDYARRGLYPLGIADEVSTERLERFFVREDAGYRIRKEIRESIVFATQNVISDPPFTRLDILSCRNLLIYLNADLQQKVFPLFFHALKPGGVLILGGAEAPTDVAAFAPINEKWRVFRRTANARTNGRVEFPVVSSRPRAAVQRTTSQPGGSALEATVEAEILERLAPLVIVVDAKGDIFFTSRRLGRFFDARKAQGSANAFALAKSDLDGYLRLLVRSALRRKKTRMMEQKGVRIRVGGRMRAVDLFARAMSEKEGAKGLVMLAISEVDPRVDDGRSTSGKDSSARELPRVRSQLRAMMLEMKRSHEELQSTNEELQSTNEELQSANEELTTSKEEMQSMNEELLTLNAELSARNEELAMTNDDMRNLLNSSQIPTLFLDNELRLKRFTAQASRIANLLPSDVGRPLTDLSLNIEYETLAEDVRSVLETLVFKERQVHGKGHEYTMRIHPYRTMENLIDGVVITFLDVTEVRRAAEERAGRESERLIEALMRRWPGIAWVEEKSSGRTIATSASTSSDLGYAREVLAAATREFWRALRPPRDRNATSGPFRLRLANGTLAVFRDEIGELSAGAGDGAACFVLHRLHRVLSDTEKKKTRRDARESPQARRETSRARS